MEFNFYRIAIIIADVFRLFPDGLFINIIESELNQGPLNNLLH